MRFNFNALSAQRIAQFFASRCLGLLWSYLWALLWKDALGDLPWPVCFTPFLLRL
jgi:hypothetical protein